MELSFVQDEDLVSFSYTYPVRSAPSVEGSVFSSLCAVGLFDKKKGSAEVWDYVIMSGCNPIPLINVSIFFS